MIKPLDATTNYRKYRGEENTLNTSKIRTVGNTSGQTTWIPPQIHHQGK